MVPGSGPHELAASMLMQALHLGTRFVRGAVVSLEASPLPAGGKVIAPRSVIIVPVAKQNHSVGKGISLARSILQRSLPQPEGC